jgi:protein-S-isoprenylcysteine O-methyltransferase Ste14
MQIGTAEERRGAARWLAREVFGTFFVGLLLFGTAGRLNWQGAWLTVGIYAVWVLANTLLIMPHNPGLLAERARRQASPNPVDNTLLSLFGLGVITKYIVAGLQARWQPESELSTATILAGLAISALGYGMVTWAMTANAFFSMVVRIQPEREHTVVQHGPYKILRHPGYLGSILFELGSPLMLGMGWAIWLGLFNALLFIIRTSLEDRILQDSLQGYTNYCKEVRYRLLPGIW